MDLKIGGLTQDLKFLPPDDITRRDTAKSVVRKMLGVLMEGWPSIDEKSDWSELYTWQVFNAIFIRRDLELAFTMREIFQASLKHIYKQLRTQTLTPAQHAQVELYLSNCLCILPFTELNPYEFVSLPQCVDKEWQLVDYKVVPIELTPTAGIEKLFIQEQDRVFAYGLEPIRASAAEPHLIFMGTNYPAGQGFALQVHTNMEGFETPGKKIYRTGREGITAFLDRQVKAGKKTRVEGQSLGGSLALLLAIDQGNKLSRVDALNPAGLYEPFTKSQHDHWDEFFAKKTAPDVYVQKQGNDIVSLFGIWKKGFHILKVTPPSIKQGPNLLFDHALNYAGHKETTFELIDTDSDNQSRKHRNTWIYVGLRASVYYLFILPHQYFFRPLLHFIWQHKLELTLMALPFALASYISLPILIILSIVAAAVAVLGMGKVLVDGVNTILGNKAAEILPEHSPDAPRMPAQDLENYRPKLSIFASNVSISDSDIEINTNIPTC